MEKTPITGLGIGLMFSNENKDIESIKTALIGSGAKINTIKDRAQLSSMLVDVHPDFRPSVVLFDSINVPSDRTLTLMEKSDMLPIPVTFLPSGFRVHPDRGKSTVRDFIEDILIKEKQKV